MRKKYKIVQKFLQNQKNELYLHQFLARTARVCEVKSEDKFLAKLLINGKLRS